MDTPIWMTGPPAGLLLATDLSARCDRAFDRAVQLAGEWRAGLVALSVLEGPQAPDLALVWAGGGEDAADRAARRQFERDLAGVDVHADLRIVKGNPVDAIREAAEETGSGLIITGMARNEALGRFLLGSTVSRLVRVVSQPLLVVRERAHGPYRRILVATDFSDSSRHALHAALRFFPDCEPIIYHAYKLPMSEISGRVSHARLRREMEEGECAAFLAGADLPANMRGRLKTVIEHGALETTLTRYVREHDIELVVIGTHGRGALMSAVIGSAAARLLDWLPCDTMIVRAPRAMA